MIYIAPESQKRIRSHWGWALGVGCNHLYAFVGGGGVFLTFGVGPFLVEPAEVERHDKNGENKQPNSLTKSVLGDVVKGKTGFSGLE